MNSDKQIGSKYISQGLLSQMSVKDQQSSGALNSESLRNYDVGSESNHQTQKQDINGPFFNFQIRQQTNQKDGDIHSDKATFQSSLASSRLQTWKEQKQKNETATFPAYNKEDFNETQSQPQLQNSHTLIDQINFYQEQLSHQNPLVKSKELQENQNSLQSASFKNNLPFQQNKENQSGLINRINDQKVGPYLNDNNLSGQQNKVSNNFGQIQQIQGYKNIQDDFDTDSIDPDEDEDIQLYNEIFESQRLFKQQFQMQAHQYRLSLHNSMRNLLNKLPKDIRNMNAIEFLQMQSQDEVFQQKFNLPFQAIDSSSIGILKNLMKLLQPVQQSQQQTSKKNNSNPPSLEDQLQQNNQFSKVMRDEEIQCRFSMRLSGGAALQQPEQHNKSEQLKVIKVDQEIQQRPPSLSRGQQTTEQFAQTIQHQKQSLDYQPMVFQDQIQSQKNDNVTNIIKVSQFDASKDYRQSKQQYQNGLLSKPQYSLNRMMTFPEFNSQLSFGVQNEKLLHDRNVYRTEPIELHETDSQYEYKNSNDFENQEEIQDLSFASKKRRVIFDEESNVNSQANQVLQSKDHLMIDEAKVQIQKSKPNKKNNKQRRSQSADESKQTLPAKSKTITASNRNKKKQNVQQKKSQDEDMESLNENPGGDSFEQEEQIEVAQVVFNQSRDVEMNDETHSQDNEAQIQSQNINDIKKKATKGKRNNKKRAKTTQRPKQNAKNNKLMNEVSSDDEKVINDLDDSLQFAKKHVITRNQLRESLESSRQNSALKMKQVTSNEQTIELAPSPVKMQLKKGKTQAKGQVDKQKNESLTINNLPSSNINKNQNKSSYILVDNNQRSTNDSVLNESAVSDYDKRRLAALKGHQTKKQKEQALKEEQEKRDQQKKEQNQKENKSQRARAKSPATNINLFNSKADYKQVQSKETSFNESVDDLQNAQPQKTTQPRTRRNRK